MRSIPSPLVIARSFATKQPRLRPEEAASAARAPTARSLGCFVEKLLAMTAIHIAVA